MREIRTYGSTRGEQGARQGMQLLSHNGETLQQRYAEAPTLSPASPTLLSQNGYAFMRLYLCRYV